MIVAFKPRFVPFVRDGSKQHTLRDERQGDRQIVAGDRLDLYENVRQKTQALLGRYLCTRVQVARFDVKVGMYAMWIDGVELSRDEADNFAWRDGFRHMIDIPTGIDLKPYSYDVTGCFPMMMDYWVKDGKTFPFEKRLIHWDHTKPTTEAMTGLGPKKRRR